MLALKANSAIKAIFHKTIRIMGENVTWTDTIMINNNSIILVGKVRSLIFNFDNRKVFSTIIDIPEEKFKTAPAVSTTLMENVLNIILYVFGKWGGIKGLTVEKNFDQLNRLIGQVLQEIEVKAELTGESFRFYKNGIQITYEDVIQLILDEMKPVTNKADTQPSSQSNGNNQSDDTNSDEYNTTQDMQNAPGAEISDDTNSIYNIGLWHKMVWTPAKYSFEKTTLSKEERMKSRLGKDFYLSGYQCPICNSKLYMVVFPLGKEFRIETSDEPVMLARSYTCNSCNNFFTPKPHKMIMDGDVYTLSLDDDKPAYTDYIELLGSHGARTSNCNFNLYESEYSHKLRKKEENLNDICENLETLSDQELTSLKDRIESHFYPIKSVAKNEKKVDKELGRRFPADNETTPETMKPTSDSIARHVQKAGNSEKSFTFHNAVASDKSKEGTVKGNNPIAKLFGKKSDSDNRSSLDIVNKTSSSIADVSPDLEVQNSSTNQAGSDSSNKHDATRIQDVSASPKDIHTLRNSDALWKILSHAVGDDHSSFEKESATLVPEQLDQLKEMITEDASLSADKKQYYGGMIDTMRYRAKQKALLTKAVSSKNSSYKELTSLIDEVKIEDSPDTIKQPILEFLSTLLKQRGKKELDAILASVPAHLTKHQYMLYKDQVSSYHEADNRVHLKTLDEKLDASQNAEISEIIKKSKVNSRDRQSIMNLYENLKAQDFEERNVATILSDLYGKIHVLDETELKKICPDPIDLSFQEALDAYDKIAAGNFLPELKIDLLKLIDKRLIKMKADECEQLVRKLTKDMDWSPLKYPGIYLNNVRQMLRGDHQEPDSVIIDNALNTYASYRGQYEYPILVCDSSRFANGKKGFVLTPDHLYYKSFHSSGVFDIPDIENVFIETDLLKKGLYVNYHKVGAYKITGALKARGFTSDQLQQLADKLDAFVTYLKEKPESRDVSYMARETHAVKCCYRCGFVYRDGDVCPKCGNRNNE